MIIFLCASTFSASASPPGDKIANTSTEIVGQREDSAEAPSNTVTTSSTDLTPGITVTEESGKVTVTNTSKGNENGAQFQAKDLKFTNLKDITYPKDWNKLTLKPGQGITLNGVVADASKPVTVSVTPVSACSTPNSDPFDPYIELFDIMPYEPGPPELMALNGSSGNVGNVPDPEEDVYGNLVNKLVDGVSLAGIYFPEAGYVQEEGTGRWTKELPKQDTVTINGVQMCRASAITASTPTPASTVTATPAPSAAPSPSVAAAAQKNLANTGADVFAILVVAALIISTGAGVMLREHHRLSHGYSKR